MSTTANGTPDGSPDSTSNPPKEGEGSSSVSDDTTKVTQHQGSTVTDDNSKFFTDLSNRLDAMPETVLNALSEKFPHLTTPPKNDPPQEKEKEKEKETEAPKEKEHAEPGNQGRAKKSFGERWFGL